MKKLFYLMLICQGLLLSCSSSDSENPNKLEDDAEGVKKGSFKTISFLSADSLPITADYYPNEDAKAIIVLLHQADFSRGEYKDIAPRLVDSGYACLAVDLRSGNFVFDIINKTAAAAKAKGMTPTYLEAIMDVSSAVDYAAKHSTKEIYLWGSSYSAGLSLMYAKQDDRVKRVIAFSPGEYFSNQSTVRSKIIGLNTPVFITGSNAEFDMVVQPLLEVLPKHNVVAFKPKSFSDHGSKTLWPACSASELTYTELFKFL